MDCRFLLVFGLTFGTNHDNDLDLLLIKDLTKAASHAGDIFIPALEICLNAGKGQKLSAEILEFLSE